MFTTGWLLDIHDHPQDGVVLWLLEDEGAAANTVRNGSLRGSPRLRLHQDFPITFYVAGPDSRLRALWRYLADEQPVKVSLRREERRDLFSPQPVTVLACQVQQAALQPRLFLDISQRFPELTYYDADLPISLRYAALHGAFPLARCRVSYSKEQKDSAGQRDAGEQPRRAKSQNYIDGGRLEEIEVLGSRWDLDPEPAPLRTLVIEPDCSPYHAEPKFLIIRTSLQSSSVAYRLPLQPERPFLINLRAILQRHDPDLLLTTWGDTWLVPRLLELSRRLKILLPLSRDPVRKIAHRPEKSYFTYGQIIHRGQQYYLFGRWHIDCCNAMLFHDYGMDGVLELGRVTALPAQTVARVSPGTGISAMQILKALELNILVPWHKQQAERPKSVLEMLRSDLGGLVYQPLIGLHRHVAEVDFISMYPSIMAHFNISPETVMHLPQNTLSLENDLTNRADLRPLPGESSGLVPQTLKPLLEKRIAIKEQLAEMPNWDPRRKAYKARASAHKWLLVTCFGYLGYKNARFGRIEAHEAVTAYGRETLLKAKEAAEEKGCTVLHMYVDGLWIRKEGLSQVADYQPLLNEIASATGLPIALDGIYRWVAFLPSRLDGRVPVANRYFGVFQDGSLKVRGIEARRGDTPPFIAQTQMEMLERLAQAPDEPEALHQALPELYALLRRRIAALRGGRVPLEKLVASQKLSRKLEEYRVPSPPARAAAQLAATGKLLQPGEMVRFLYTRGKPGVIAWDLPEAPDPAMLDIPRYIELLLRAGSTIVEPLGVSERGLRECVLSNSYQLPATRGSFPAARCPFPAAWKPGVIPARPLGVAQDRPQYAVRE